MLRPLSAHALFTLRELARGDIEQWKINPGVRNKLYVEGLAAQRMGRGVKDPGLVVITDRGRAYLADKDKG